MRISGLIACMLCAALAITVPWTAFAQAEYPNRAIRFVVPIPPGVVADTLPRILAEKLSARWGQPVIIENRPGAALNLGAEVVAKAPPDGYTLLATPQGPLVISQSFFPKLGFDPGAFVPVSIYAELPYLLVVNPKVAASTLQELIAYAKANPGKINYASSGTGSSLHLTIEMLAHVPYQGAALIVMAQEYNAKADALETDTRSPLAAISQDASSVSRERRDLRQAR
jgi:tripartite-type tricarboxylate transporter receptor subunit TctC